MNEGFLSKDSGQHALLNQSSVLDSSKDIWQISTAYMSQNPCSKFNDVQAEVSAILGRKPVRAERAIITSVFRETACKRAAAERAREEMLYMNMHGAQRKGFVICTSYTDNYKIGHLCSSVNEKYAAKWGYEWIMHVLPYEELMSVISPRQCASWYKIRMLLELLDRELGCSASAPNSFLPLPPSIPVMQSPKGCAYLFWIDADACIINSEVPLTKLAEMGDHVDLILGEDMNCGSGSFINAGVLLVRVSEWSRRFLQDVWAQQMEAAATAAYDAAARNEAIITTTSTQSTDVAAEEIPFFLRLRKQTQMQLQLTGQMSGARHYFFVRQFEQSAIQKVLKSRQQGLEASFRECDAACKCNNLHLRAFHTFSPLNEHISLLAAVQGPQQEQALSLLSKKIFANVCILPSHVMNSSVRPDTSILRMGLAPEHEDEDEDEESCNIEEEDDDEDATLRGLDEVGNAAGLSAVDESARGASSSALRRASQINPPITCRAGAQKPASFIYHPAGKKRKEHLIRTVLASLHLIPE